MENMSLSERARAAIGSNIFANRDSGALCRVKKVDDSFAYIEVLGDQSSGWAGMSFNSMPVADYDEHFGDHWRPATAADLIGVDDDDFRPPENIPDDWQEYR